MASSKKRTRSDGAVLKKVHIDGKIPAICADSIITEEECEKLLNRLQSIINFANGANDALNGLKATMIHGGFC